MNRLVWAVIPAYNEGHTVAEVVRRTLPHVARVLVVNDGSTDCTEEQARVAGADVVSHLINRGLGAALSTGFTAAIEGGAEVVVTLDADLQHNPEEIPKLIAATAMGAEVVIGSRAQSRKSVPWYRQVAHVLGNVSTWLLFGSWVSDSQSGFRAITKHALTKMDLKTSRMEISSEIVAESKRHRLNLVEVPIEAIYTEYSLSKGQSLTVGVKTLLKLILHRLAH